MKDEDAGRTITGRLKKPIEFIDIPGIPKYMRDIIALLARDVVINTGLDFSQHPDRSSAAIIRHLGDGKIEVESLEMSKILGREPHFVIDDDLVSDGSTLLEDISYLIGLDYSKLETLILSGSSYGKTKMMSDFYDMPEPEAGEPKEPMKQNGRSAAYLSFDKTKNHRKRR